MAWYDGLPADIVTTSRAIEDAVQRTRRHVTGEAVELNARRTKRQRRAHSTGALKQVHHRGRGGRKRRDDLRTENQQLHAISTAPRRLRGRFG
jgi:hypothetical protein